MTLPHYDSSRKSETTAEAILTFEWSGGCADGRRDGEGVLSWVEDRSFSGGFRGVTRYRAVGRFVRGERLGLWCFSSTTQSVMAGTPPRPERPQLTDACAVYGGNIKRLTPFFQKQADGSWRQLAAGQLTDTTAAAGTLEAQSQKVLAEARGSAATPPAAVALGVESRTLDDLVQGARIVLAPSNEPIAFKQKRVALLLSSATLREIERFRRERQAFVETIGRTPSVAAETRERILAASSADRFLANLLAGVAGQVAFAKPEDDLIALSQRQYDYALVLNWKSMVRFDLLGKYETFPKVLPARPGTAPACMVIGGYLISRELKAVRSFELPAVCWPKSAGGDTEYLNMLVRFFELAWGKGGDDRGLMLRAVALNLKQ